MAVLRNRKDYDCAACKWGRHCDDSNPAPYRKFVLKGFMKSRTCFLPMVTPRASYLIELFQHYQSNHLFVPGGVSSQPHVYMHAMSKLSELATEAPEGDDDG